ncbi:hypothetical protein TNCT6_71970 [Streptomyces sp. 6-11-2]|nr:hypothetical protein TNCT6_71970 [Streptomyces sp. 6-11-2]
MKSEEGLLDEGPDLRVRPAHRLLACGEGLPPSPVRDADRAASTPITLVGPAPEAGLGEGTDGAMCTGRADVVDGARQGRMTRVWTRR